MSIHVQPLNRPHETYTDWLIYKQGDYSRPLAILSNHEMHRLIRAVAAHDPEGAQAAVDEAKAYDNRKPAND